MPKPICARVKSVFAPLLKPSRTGFRRSIGTAPSPLPTRVVELDAVKRLARCEGIFTEPAGGTTLAATVKLVESGRIPRDESICVSITGNGLKTVEALEGQLDVAPVIAARIEEFQALVEAPSEPTSQLAS